MKPSAPHQVLDPSLLGRPVHLLHLFADQLREDLTQSMRLNMNRRYWGGFQVEEVEFSRLDGTERTGRWLNFAAPAGTIAFSLDRKVLLSVLNFRYGRNKSDAAVAAAAAVDESTVRVTATEERLAVVLGQQLAGTLAGRIELNLPVSDKPVPLASEEFKPAAANHPPKGTWVICVALSDADSGSPGRYWFALDKNLMASVLRGLLRERDQGKKPMRSAGPLAQRLQVSLSGRLVSKEVPLEELRLFTAVVSEHKGKLCLTSFEDAE